MSSPSDENEITISSSPHFFNKHGTVKETMFCVIISLLPLCIYGIILYGIPALITILISVITCVASEALFQLAIKKPITISDGSAIVTGIMLALVLPPTTPIWMTILGAIFAIVVAKGFFGGLGANVFNPALAGRAFMFMSFPAAMGSAWLIPGAAKNATDAISSATVLSQVKEGMFFADTQTYSDFFFGNRAGCIGESSILLILIAFIFLALIRVIDWRAPIAMISVTVLCTLISGGDAILAVLSGGLMFGAVFMVTDYATAPVTNIGRLIFGAGCGLITFLIRKFGGYPEGVMFSILIMNAIAPFLNNLVSRKYGYAKKSIKKTGEAK